jgi:hypothetical protein
MEQAAACPDAAASLHHQSRSVHDWVKHELLGCAEQDERFGCYMVQLILLPCLPGGC